MGINGYVVSRALAFILMELISVCFYLFVGYLDRPKQDRVSQLEESHKVEGQKGVEIQIVIYEPTLNLIVLSLLSISSGNESSAINT